ncbi:unnamed protein product [Oreochromis niloticus]|nr:unnamed protein product [Mustela putorius furo]
MCQMSVVIKHRNPHSGRAIDPLGTSPQAIPQAYCNLASLSVKNMPFVSLTELSTAQREDPGIGQVWSALSNGNSNQVDKTKHPTCSLLLREWDRLKMQKGVMYRIVTPPGKSRCSQLVLPEKYRTTVLKSLHDDSGHLGLDKTYGLIKDRFYWPRMKSEIEEYCKSCERCIKRKTLPKRVAPLSHLQSDGPFDLVCMDFLSIEPDSSNTENVLVITDHYTRYAQAFPTKDQKASTVAKVLLEKYFVHYGLPQRMHSDQGRDFESRLVHEVLSSLGVKKSRTTPYHPQGDPQPERFNRTLLDMLGTLEPNKKKKWSQHIVHLVHAYNCTPNEATGFSPYFLMFGREARLPVDLCFETSGDGTQQKTYLKYVSDMRKELKAAYELAESVAAKQNDNNKQRYDKRIRFAQLLPGDRVLLRNLGLQGKHKLADRWASKPYVVESKMPNLPVFRLKPEDGDGPIKILHRNHLLPLGKRICLDPESHTDLTPTRRVLRRRKQKERTDKPEKEKTLSQKTPDKDSEREGVTPSDQVEKEYIDSEDEDYGLWYDLTVEPLRNNMDDDTLEPFSLDLDISLSDLTEQPKTVELGVTQECVEEPEMDSVNEFESTETTETELPETCENHEEIDKDKTLTEEILLQEEDTELNSETNPDFDIKTRPQRLKRAPLRLTYDEPGHPSVVAAPTVKYVSCIYKWIGTPIFA